MPIYSDKDPIVAIATASGRGGVGIVRLSADDSFIEGFIKDFFGPSEHFKARYAHYRPFKDRNGNQIDEGLALYFPAPKSYTGESVLELQAHGGPVILKLLLQEILRVGKSKGLRLAEPGEFTPVTARLHPARGGNSSFGGQSQCREIEPYESVEWFGCGYCDRCGGYH